MVKEDEVWWGKVGKLFNVIFWTDGRTERKYDHKYVK